MFTVTDDDFDTGPAKEVVTPGHYKMRIINDAQLTTSKAGARKLLVPMVAYENTDGKRVNSKVIRHKITLEGSPKAEKVGADQFAQLLTAVGYTAEAVKNIAAALATSLPSAEEIAAGQYGQISANLNINGDPVNLKKRTLMGSLKVESYEGTEYNKVSSLWADSSKE
jgi:hypothetical protein